MKIVSNYKDYYDSCQKYGIDKSILYVRKEQQIELFEKDLNLAETIQLSKDKIFYSNFKYLLTLNPSLKELNFVKLFDPYTAYQEIEMFISSVIGSQSPQLVNIGNEDMLKKKGFDKWSFRKQSNK